jgi:HipA-like protein
LSRQSVTERARTDETHRSLVVIIEQRLAATISRSRAGLRLQYDAAYPADATPLSVSMPVAVKEHTDAVVTPWLWGLLPDNAEVLRDTWVKVASELKLKADTVVERVQELATVAPNAFREASAAPSLSTFDGAFSERLCDAVADRAADCLRVLS